MTTQRALMVLLAATLAACTGTLFDDLSANPPGEDPPGEDPPDRRIPPEELPEWGIYLDTSSTDPYVAGNTGRHTISGYVTAPEGIGTLIVGDGDRISVGSDGRFEAEVPVAPGMHLVELEAVDGASPPHTRRGNVSLVVAEFLPEGDMNATAAALALTDAVVGPMGDPMQGLVSGLDIASEIMARHVLTEDSMCVTHPTSARHGTPRLRLFVSEAGELWLEVLVPGLSVNFYGACDLFITRMDITGNMETDVAIMTRLTAPPGEDCVRGLEHEPPVIELRGFDLDVSGGAGLFESLLVMLMGEISESDSEDTLAAELASEAETMLGPELEDITIFESSTAMDLLGSSMNMDLCVTGLVTDNNVLLATVGARVQGSGTATAPGAPLYRGEGGLPTPQPNSFYLDANLVGQMVFSAWRAGGLTSEDAAEIDLGLLELLCPDLDGLFPEGSVVSVSLDGRTAPLVRAVTEGRGDLVLEIGNMDLIMEVDGELLFRVGTQLAMVLDLVPDGSSLRPTVVVVEATSYVAEEPILDVDDEVLASAIQLQIGAVAGELLGDAAIELPAVGAPLIPLDVVPVEGGQYVQVLLE